MAIKFIEIVILSQTLKEPVWITFVYIFNLLQYLICNLFFCVLSQTWLLNISKCLHETM